jgi:hypothetical protein
MDRKRKSHGSKFGWVTKGADNKETESANSYNTVIDNINLYVILIDKNDSIILFKGEASPSLWGVYPKNKTWIYSYFSTCNIPKRR